MAEFQVTFRDRRTGKVSTMKVEDATRQGANETAHFFRVSRGDVVKVEPVKA